MRLGQGRAYHFRINKGKMYIYLSYYHISQGKLYNLCKKSGSFLPQKLYNPVYFFHQGILHAHLSKLYF